MEESGSLTPSEATLRRPSLLRQPSGLNLRRFGADLGLAFQLVDDTLDGDGVAAALGRRAARQEAMSMTRAAIDSLKPLGRRATPLRNLAERMSERKK